MRLLQHSAGLKCRCQPTAEPSIRSPTSKPRRRRGEPARRSTSAKMVSCVSGCGIGETQEAGWLPRDRPRRTGPLLALDCRDALEELTWSPSGSTRWPAADQRSTTVPVVSPTRAVAARPPAAPLRGPHCSATRMDADQAPGRRGGGPTVVEQPGAWAEASTGYLLGATGQPRTGGGGAGPDRHRLRRRVLPDFVTSECSDAPCRTRLCPRRWRPPDRPPRPTRPRHRRRRCPFLHPCIPAAPGAPR